RGKHGLRPVVLPGHDWRVFAKPVIEGGRALDVLFNLTTDIAGVLARRVPKDVVDSGSVRYREWDKAALGGTDEDTRRESKMAGAIERMALSQAPFVLQLSQSGKEQNRLGDGTHAAVRAVPARVNRLSSHRGVTGLAVDRDLEPEHATRNRRNRELHRGCRWLGNNRCVCPVSTTNARCRSELVLHHFFADNGLENE